MYIKINEYCVMYQAIESFCYNETEQTSVIRTVSGKEHSKKMTKEKAESVFASIVELMAINEVI